MGKMAAKPITFLLYFITYLKFRDLVKRADFLAARLPTAISRTVIGEEAKRQLEKLFAYENANQECQKSNSSNS